MTESRMKRLALLITLAVAILAGSIYLFAKSVPPRPFSVTPPAIPNPLPAGQMSSTQPKITWSPTSTLLILPPGDGAAKDFTFVSNQNLQNVVVEAVPEIASFLTIQPSNIANVSASQPQPVHISLSIPAGTALGAYLGTIHLRVGSTTIPQTLKVSIAVVKQSLILTAPQNYDINSQTLVLGGPISLNNFANNYQQGGIVPLGGAEIDITNVKLPTTPLMQFITAELQGATITSTTAITVSGNAATEVFYTDTYTPTLAFKNIAVYVPHNDLVYKIYLTYRAGDPLESQFLASFQQILDKIQFAP